MAVHVTAWDVGVGVGIAFLIIWALAWLEERWARSQFRENRRMHHQHSEHP
jgi:hypothetical protein